MKSYETAGWATMATIIYQNVTSMDVSTENATNSTEMSAPPRKYNRNVRLGAFIIIFVISIIGNSIVCTWMWTHRKHKSRMNKMILSLTLADLFVTLCPLVTEFVRELLPTRQWVAGDGVCRTVMLLQAFAIHASTNSVVVISIDRHRALRNPFSRNIPVKILVSGAWIAAFMFSTPQAFVWHLGYRRGVPRCTSIFATLPTLHVKIYMVYASLVVFLIPFCIICILYLQILKTVWERGKEININKKGAGHKQMNAIISRAKIKTLKMTLVIILTFIVCGMPYFLMETILNSDNSIVIEPNVYAVLGIFALSNSAANPFVFLFFNSDNKLFLFLEQRFCFTCFKTQEVKGHPIKTCEMDKSDVTTTLSCV